MEFTYESEIVKTWVRLVQSGKYEEEKIPNIGNLKDVVIEVINSL